MPFGHDVPVVVDGATAAAGAWVVVAVVDVTVVEVDVVEVDVLEVDVVGVDVVVDEDVGGTVVSAGIAVVVGLAVARLATTCVTDHEVLLVDENTPIRTTAATNRPSQAGRRGPPSPSPFRRARTLLLALA